jgi:hypothetical protein
MQYGSIYQPLAIGNLTLDWELADLASALTDQTK